MALNHEKKVRHLYPLFGFSFFVETSFHHLRQTAVIKGTSNAPGGFAVKPWTIHCTGLVYSMRRNRDFVHTF